MMNEWMSALLVLAILLGSAMAGLLVRPLLSERHWNRDTSELVKLVSTMLLTFAALVLGLLTTSAKSSFDQIGGDIQRYGVQLIQLDRLLTEYGPETRMAREQLRNYTAAAIATTWREEPRPEGDSEPSPPIKATTNALAESAVLGDMLGQVDVELRHLEPTDAMHRKLANDLLNGFEGLVQQRWKLIEEAQGVISMPFFLVLVFWLVMVFASFGLMAPRNLLAFTVLVLGAASIASAIFVILDLDTPFGGLFRVSSQPLRTALVHLSH